MAVNKMAKVSHRNFALLNDKNMVIGLINSPISLGLPPHTKYVEIGDIKIDMGMVYKNGVFKKPFKFW